MRLWVQDSLSCMQISLQEAGGLSYFLGAADEVRPWWQLGARGPGWWEGLEGGIGRLSGVRRARRGATSELGGGQ